MIEPILVEELRAAACVRIELREEYDGIGLVAHASSDHAPGTYWHREAHLALELRLAARVECLIHGSSYRWDFESPANRDGVFGAFAAWVLDQLDSPELDAMEDEESAPPYAAALASICDRAAARAVRHCDPSARALALAFPRDARMFVYRALLDDWFRRVEQMIGVCPGLFVLASTFPPAWPALRDGILAGTRLTSLAGGLASAIAARNRHAAALIRRAPRELEPTRLLAILREPNADANDLPASETCAAAWYTWCASTALREPRMVGFVSKHVNELAELARERGQDAPEMLGAILDWAHATGARLPSRNSTPANILAAVDRWHDTLWRSVDYDPSTPFPPAPSALVPTDGIAATPLTTVGELLDEGRRMNHCVGSHAARAVSGEQSFYRASVHGEPVTIAVGRTRDGCHLVQASGIGNRKPSHMTIIERWVKTLRSSCDE